MDPFACFGLPPRFPLDLTDLAQHYYQLQNRHHPDRAQALPPADALVEAQTSAAINDAYRTLRSPLLRARALLERADVALPRGGEGLDADFLEQAIDWRERLEYLQQRPPPAQGTHAPATPPTKTADTDADWEILAAEIDQARTRILSTLEALFGDAAAPPPAAQPAAVAAVQRLAFLDKLQDALLEIQIAG